LKSQSVYKIDSEDQFILSQDLSGDAIYINSKEKSLLFNTRLQQFESFTPHNGVPFMCNQFGKFLSIVENKEDNTTVIWENNVGNYGEFYGDYHDSYITYLMNPEPMYDKTFDVLQYRMDVFKPNKNGIDEYLENDTFSEISVKNEFQSSNLKLDKKDRRNPNVRKKFRMWNVPIPRATDLKKGLNTLQRMRNP